MNPDALTTQVAIGVVIAHVIEWLKNREWFPWLDCHSTEVTRWVSRFVAVASGIGITATMGDHSVTLSWPTQEVAARELIGVINSWAVQQAAYKGLIKENPKYLVRPPAALPASEGGNGS